jgi:hypothetical protein
VKGVIFACVHNAGRSQMAAAFFNALADPVSVRAISAGTAPASRVHPEVVDVMRARERRSAARHDGLWRPVSCRSRDATRRLAACRPKGSIGRGGAKDP